MNTKKRPAILGDIFDIMGTWGCLILVGRDYFGFRTESCLTVDVLNYHSSMGQGILWGFVQVF